MSWTPVEAALVTAVVEWSVECANRPPSGRGSDCSDLMTTLLGDIQGICSGEIDPTSYMLSKQ